MILLMIANKVRLDGLPIPEDDVELRVRGIWVIASVLLTMVGGIFVFICVYTIQYAYDWFRKIWK